MLVVGAERRIAEAMMDPSLEKQIFESALDLASAAERAAYVMEAAAGNEALAARVLLLLQASETMPAFLPGAPRCESARSGGEGVGAVLGSFQLVERLGEGGFGVVWRAEQREPVRRFVALKVVKAGMDSCQVIARFEAERQALALMDHPGIARVFEAGMTSSGRPFFAMELIVGTPITRYCQDCDLDIAGRLELVIQVCDAVQHAHQKGVLHRDLKPSNILVATVGERPVPKIIDFGIAKALREPLTDKTILTQLQQFLGTPSYMSPEQVVGAVDVDTRSDIYGLGVLVYELLVGVPPFDSRELGAAGLESMRKTICEKEPDRPSTRLARRRRHDPIATDSVRLLDRDSRISRELDLIVLKAIEKDRERRYATANGLAADLRRYLNHEPVAAVAPTLTYQLSKLYRRHRATVTSALAFAVLLGLAAVVSSSWAWRARQAQSAAVREAATARNVSDFLWREILKRLTPWSHTNSGVTLREAFDAAAGRIEYRLGDDPLAEAAVRLAVGRTYMGLSEFPAAESNLVRSVTLYRTHQPVLDESAADALFQLATLREFQGRFDDAELLFGEAARVRARSLGSTHRDAVSAAAKAGRILSLRLPPAEAERLLLMQLDQMRRHVGSNHFVSRAILNALALRRLETREYDAAYRWFEESLRLTVDEEGPFSAGALANRGELARILALQGRYTEAEAELLEIIAIGTRTASSDHLFTLGARVMLFQSVLIPRRRHEDAASLVLDLARIGRSKRPEFLPTVALCRTALIESWKSGGGGEGLEAFERQSSALLSPAEPGTNQPSSAAPE
ncbi:MAG: serine/threonine protein kinase [Verrucomicrobiales bacterium]|nr:serine/threonine protein kinase [Verrucomicrobiales bacterium]